MSNISMCRVCLSVDVKLDCILNTPIQTTYEKITNIPFPNNDGKPVLACYICKNDLRRCHSLITRALQADQLLTDILNGGLGLDQIDRSSFKLKNNLTKSPIEYITNIQTVDDDKTSKEEVKVKQECVKVEKKCEEIVEKCEGEDLENNDDGIDHQSSQTDPEVNSSDSEDDIPLNSISKKSREQKNSRAKKTKWVQKCKEKGFKADFAKEIVLTKQEQLQEIQERATSLNYLNSPMKCELCYKGFVDSRAFENHTRKHDQSSGAHECLICRMRYTSARQLRTHAHTSHSRRYQCQRCSHRSHTANQAREHEKWHSGHTYECKLCGQAFRKPTSYLTHMRKRHPTQHVCTICGDSFVGRHGLLMHKSKSHKDKIEEDGTAKSERYCADCSIQFASVDAWKWHILSSNKHTLAIEHSLQCMICSTRLISRSSVEGHLREHQRALRPRATPRTDVHAGRACDQCGSKFVNVSKLQAHVRRVHLGLKYNKNIVCELCGKKCTSNASLKYHQRTHTGEKPYPCATCNKRFADNNQLRIHTRTHTGERPYCCAVCGKRFSQKPALNRHYRVHTGAKPYTCDLCSKPFSQSNSLKLHIRSVHLKMPAHRRSRQTDGQTDAQTASHAETPALQNV